MEEHLSGLDRVGAKVLSGVGKYLVNIGGALRGRAQWLKERGLENPWVTAYRSCGLGGRKLHLPYPLKFRQGIWLQILCGRNYIIDDETGVSVRLRDPRVCQICRSRWLAWPELRSE